MRSVTALSICLFAMGGCDKQAPSSAQKISNDLPAASSPSNAIGRYTIIHSPEVERDTMLIDTVTGDTWQLVKLDKKDDSSMGWEFVGKIDQPSPASSSSTIPEGQFDPSKPSTPVTQNSN